MKNNTKWIILLICGFLIYVGACLYAIVYYPYALNVLPKEVLWILLLIDVGAILLGASMGIWLADVEEMEKCTQ